MRALQEQMHISQFDEAVHLSGIDRLHGAAQVCCPCRPKRGPKMDPLNSGSSCPVATKKLVSYDKQPNLFPKIQSPSTLWAHSTTWIWRKYLVSVQIENKRTLVQQNIDRVDIQGWIQGGCRGPAPLTTKNEAPAPKFSKIEAPEWQF